MKITASDEKGNVKLRFDSINNIEFRYASDPLFCFGSPIYSRKRWENIEIKTLIATPADHRLYYDLVMPGEMIRLKMEGPISCYLTGYFERLDTEMNFDGTCYITLLFHPLEVSDMYVMDEFELAMITAKTTNAAIEAAIRLSGK